MAASRAFSLRSLELYPEDTAYFSSSIRAASSSARVAWARGALCARTAVADATSSSAEAVRRDEMRWIVVFALKSHSLGYRVTTAGSVLPRGVRETVFQDVAR